MKLAFIIFISIVSFFSIAFAQAKTCGALFFSTTEKITLSEEQYDKAKNVTASAVADTTGLRNEDKFVVSHQAVRGFLVKLTRSLGPLEMREKAEPGFANLTYTSYAQPFRFYNNGQKRTAKIRVRYYLIENLKSGEIVRNPFTADSKFLELKIDHPVTAKVVTKGRLRLSDTDVELVMNPSKVTANLSAIKSRAQQDKVNPQDSVETLLDLIPALHGDGTTWNPKYGGILYRREAYRITLIAKDGTPVDIQITIDQDIRFTLPGSMTVIHRYPKNVRVVEVKIPVKYAALTGKDLEEVPGLNVIKEALTKLSGYQQDGFVLGNGKFSTFRQMIKNDSLEDWDRF